MDLTDAHLSQVCAIVGVVLLWACLSRREGRSTWILQLSGSLNNFVNFTLER